MRVTAEHWKRILEIAEENPKLITNQFCGSNGKANLNTLWQSVVNSLNSLGYGEKSVAEWRKVKSVHILNDLITIGTYLFNDSNRLEKQNKN
ncbi:hypothetical protein NQ314_006268 [Rhamnusium bicolor]|uniref:Regulatory protein zeste n=1 Tax=Rhamnusium bicolor TaxID=1586634 RepID=A0AAV8Z636_9CUCU|nr:hypothetical protein NQ314_006268 [Rhamnusium bicolor]